jgi:hypothetical protein
MHSGPSEERLLQARLPTLKCSSSTITKQIHSRLAASQRANDNRETIIAPEISRHIETLSLPPKSGRIRPSENASLESRVELPPTENIPVADAGDHTEEGLPRD